MDHGWGVVIHELRVMVDTPQQPGVDPGSEPLGAAAGCSDDSKDFGVFQTTKDALGGWHRNACMLLEIGGAEGGC